MFLNRKKTFYDARCLMRIDINFNSKVFADKLFIMIKKRDELPG